MVDCYPFECNCFIPTDHCTNCLLFLRKLASLWNVNLNLKTQENFWPGCYPRHSLTNQTSLNICFHIYLLWPSKLILQSKWSLEFVLQYYPKARVSHLRYFREYLRHISAATINHFMYTYAKIITKQYTICRKFSTYSK